MVSKKKHQDVKIVTKQLEDYPVVGILDMHKLPGRQLHEIRNKLRGQIVIRMVKKRLISLILEKKNMGALNEHIQGEPALFMTKENPFKIARVLQNSKSPAAAKPGDIAPIDIVVPEGPTPLPPGPAIGEFQKLKIPAGVEGDKIVVKKDTIIVKEGEVIDENAAGLMSKLSIEPMEIGLNLIAVLENNTVYDKDILFIPEDYYIDQLKSSSAHALNLSVYINYFTKENIPLLLGKANSEAESLTMQADIVSPSTIKTVLAKSNAQVKSVESKINV